MLRAVLFLVALQLVSACGSDQPSGAGPVVSKSLQLPEIATRSYAGKVGDTDAYVAVTDLDGTVLVYLCDGKPGNATVLSRWFHGTLVENQLWAVARDGSTLTATLDGSTLTGSFELVGTGSRAFSAGRTSKPGGLWMALGNTDAFSEENPGVLHLAAWVVLPDGTQRGALRTPSETTAASILNTADGSNTSGDSAAYPESPRRETAIGKTLIGDKVCSKLSSIASYHWHQPHSNAVTPEQAGAAVIGWYAVCYSKHGSLTDYL